MPTRPGWGNQRFEDAPFSIFDVSLGTRDRFQVLGVDDQDLQMLSHT